MNKLSAKQSEAGFGILILVVLLGIAVLVIVILILGQKFFSKPSSNELVSTVIDPVLLHNNETATGSTSTVPASVDLWKEYKNTDYNFALIIPAQGIVTTDKGTQIGACGADIQKDSDPSPYDAQYTIDNLTQISIVNYPGSIEDYLKDNGADGKYNLVALSKTNADEAYELKGLTDEGKTWANGYYEGIPFGLTKGIFKKGDTLVILHDIQSPGDYSGCVTGTDGQKELDWNPAENFRFL